MIVDSVSDIQTPVWLYKHLCNNWNHLYYRNASQTVADGRVFTTGVHMKYACLGQWMLFEVHARYQA